MLKEIKVGEVVFGDNNLGIIAGPCVIENRDHSLKMSAAINEISKKVQSPIIFKSSFDKANRTSIESFRGPGIQEGLKILSDVKSETGMKVLTDIHTAEQAAIVAEVVDIIQIPAFLSRQTDILLAAAKTGKTVNIKKGQFLAPWDVEHIVKKVEESGSENILLTDRGTQFGYNNLVADMRAIPLMQNYGYPVIFDATHSAQLPGGSGGHSSGMRDMIPTLAKSAVAAGCNGVFMEVHDNVDLAKSDAATQWPLDQLTSLLMDLKKVHNSLR
ncbi:3-deoxy-8-phosphooctulonate synthase [Candidatus Marinimicrobia bacterium]|jgi:2-dehydro-3-deoxyphosphooctonate aldolase (KDO 8-P synthase)|nr:3-deoxy-8-phosphooctulonate synthase [Candidatus Neomarinimicrobiota bacterium]